MISRRQFLAAGAGVATAVAAPLRLEAAPAAGLGPGESVPSCGPAEAISLPPTPESAVSQPSQAAPSPSALPSAEAAARPRSVARVVRLRSSTLGDGFHADRVYGDMLGDLMDPFLNIDHFRMSEKTFPPHPHAGFSAVTVLFEDAETGVSNRDSMGDVSVIAPGSIHWMQAGRGIVHEENPAVLGRVCHGAQVFVNLAERHKGDAPRVFKTAPDAMTTFRTAEGVRGRVLTGESNGHSAHIEGLATPVTMVDLHLPPGSSYRHLAPADHNLFVLVVSGQGAFGEEGVRAAQGQAVGFARGAESARIAAGETALHVLLCAGRPLNEPVFFQGPFVASSAAGLRRAFEDYHSGRMGRLPE